MIGLDEIAELVDNDGVGATILQIEPDQIECPMVAKHWRSAKNAILKIQKIVNSHLEVEEDDDDEDEY